MPIYIPHPGETDFKPVPVGPHPARCCRVVELGTQESNFKGEKKFKPQVLVTWELKSRNCRLDNGKSMVIHRRYTWSMNEKGKLREHLEGWRGQPFTKADFGTFDICKLLGAPCLVTVAHSVNPTNGKTSAKVSAVAKPLDGMTVGELENDKEFLSLDPRQFNQEAFDKLPDWIKALIELSPEYRGLKDPKDGVDDGDPGYNPSNFDRSPEVVDLAVDADEDVDVVTRAKRNSQAPLDSEIPF
jgi:hypothetical protein